MHRWLIWSLAAFALCGCQTGGGPMSADCPTPGPCDEAGQDVRPLFGAPVVTVAATMPLWPGCPSTLQVMAPLQPVVFHSVLHYDEHEAAPDPSDGVCETPDAPLLRTDLGRSRPDVAGR
jgi:hypothetical protein